ncbi:alpha/beta hydrolase [Candidatus Gottesmanbacteria bacterium]|nr:alpha/beta hydrolase [Candidatus Gottesmanbacteria bacterium]
MEEKSIDISRGKMTYLVCGNGPPLVFLHGGLSSARGYIPFIELLGKSFRVIAPTHPGHGDSFALPKKWELDDFGSSYHDFFETLNLGPVPVVGHSFGGTIGFLLASRRDASSLIVMDSLGLPISLSMKKYVQALTHEGKAMLAGIKKRKQFTDMLSSSSTILYSSMKHPENASWLHSYGPNLDMRDILTSLTCHVDLLWGEDDAIVPVAIGYEMHRMLRDSTLTIFPDKGHTYMVTDPEFACSEILLRCRTIAR